MGSGKTAPLRTRQVVQIMQIMGFSLHAVPGFGGHPSSECPIVPVLGTLAILYCSVFDLMGQCVHVFLRVFPLAYTLFSV